MRDDLDKVITESPRSGGSWGGKKFPRQRKHKGDFEGMDQVRIKTSIRDAYGTNRDVKNRRTKTFTDVLAPIYGLIRKNVGKNWDKLFSDMRKKFKPDSRVHQHIYEHLFQFIEVKTRIQNGVIEYNDGRTSWRHKPWNPIDSSVEFYVHPKTNCIIRNKKYKTYTQANKERYKERLAEEAKTKKVISKDLEAHKIKDVWYLFEFDLTPKVQYTEKSEIIDGAVVVTKTSYAPAVTDLLASSMNIAHLDIYGKYEEGYKWMNSYKRTEVNKSFRTGNTTEIRERYAKSKKQLSHKELKGYGLI